MKNTTQVNYFQQKRIRSDELVRGVLRRSELLQTEVLTKLVSIKPQLNRV